MFIKDYNKTAIIYNDIEISYKEVISYINDYIEVLGNNSYDKIAILAENRTEWIYAFYAGWALGSIMVPIDHSSNAEEIEYILNDCTPELIVYTNKTAENYKSAKENINYKIIGINLDELITDNKRTDSNINKFSNIGQDLKKTALIIYTSGTTGSSKGVMLSFENLMSNIVAVVDDVQIFKSEDKVMALLPFHHILPLMGTIILVLYSGGAIVFSPSMSGEDMVKTLKNHHISIMIGVPRLYDLIRKAIMDQLNKKAVARLLYKIAKSVNSLKFSRIVFSSVHKKFGGNLKYLVSGGAALDPITGTDMNVLGFEILEGYGMTEAAPMISFTRPGDVIVGSPGLPLPCNIVKVVEEEIRVQGPNVMQGYYNKPEETKEVLVDGWLRTGDKGYADEKGHLFITGRFKELIILSNGKNVNPVEIEQKISAYSEGLLQEFAVFERNNLLSIVIVPDYKKAKELNINDINNINNYIRDNIIAKYNHAAQSYKKISSVFFTDTELPKTRMSKIKRYMLNDLVLDNNLKAKTEEPQTEEFAIMKDYFKSRINKEISILDNLEMDLGLDSLEKITLCVFVNTSFGVKLREEELLNYPTINDLMNYIAENKTKAEIEQINWGDIFKQKMNMKLPKAWLTQLLLKHSARIFLSLYFRTKAKGVENLPAGPMILAPNHQSYLDGLFVTAFMKDSTLRKTYFYAKQKHVKNFFLKFMANTNNVIVMDMNKDLKLSLQKMAEVLKRGKNIIIFPEGTRSYTGALGDFKKTFAILSRELNVPIVPIAIDGSINALPRGSVFPRPFKKVTIEYFKPVYPEETHTYDTLAEKIKDIISEKIK